MQNAKLGLSEEELSLVSDPGIILTKNAIIAKVYDMFGMLADEQKQMVLPAQAGATPPKISRGENYKGLPYVVLDFPRLFTSQHVMAIRTHFWWGNYFSVTLHLKGEFCRLHHDVLLTNFEDLSMTGHMLCLAEDEWEHELREPFYSMMSRIGYDKFRQALQSLPFIKIAKPFPLLEWNNMFELLREEQRAMAELLR